MNYICHDTITNGRKNRTREDKKNMQDIIQRPGIYIISPLIVTLNVFNLAEKLVCVYFSGCLIPFGTRKKLSSKKRINNEKASSVPKGSHLNKK